MSEQHPPRLEKALNGLARHFAQLQVLQRPVLPARLRRYSGYAASRGGGKAIMRPAAQESNVLAIFARDELMTTRLNTNEITTILNQRLLMASCRRDVARCLALWNPHVQSIRARGA